MTPRSCATCGTPLTQGPGESVPNFARRRFCDRVCYLNCPKPPRSCSWPECDNRPAARVTDQGVPRWVCGVHEAVLEVPA